MMIRIVAITILAIVAIIPGTTTGFVLPFSTQDQQRLLAKATDDTDFDAPVLKNPVMKTDAPTVLDHEIMVVDDECYLGKYGQYDECVDFDPIHKSAQEKAAFEMPDFAAIGEEIGATLKKLFAQK